LYYVLCSAVFGDRSGQTQQTDGCSHWWRN